MPHDDPCRSELGRSNSLYVASLAKGMIVLESFFGGANYLGIVDIVRITGFEKNLVQRLVSTLYQLGYLGKDPVRRKYFLTPKILSHSFNYLQSNHFISIAIPGLIDLREELGKAVNMCVLNGTHITYLVRLWKKYYYEASLFGEHIPAYVASGGRMLLAMLETDTAREILESTRRTAYTPKTRTDLDDLMDQVALAKKQGYCWQVGEFIEKEISIATPMVDAEGNAAAVIVTYLLKKVTEENCRQFIEETLPALRSTTRAITRRARGILPT